MPHNKPTDNSKPDSLLKQLWKPLSFLLLLIMICAFLARYLTGAETLEDYARNNPEIAYGEHETAKTDSDEKSSDTNISGSTADNPSAYDKTKDPSTPMPPNTSDAIPSKSADSKAGLEEKADMEKPIEMNTNQNRVTYQEGFYYEPLSEEVKKRITGISYPLAESKAADTAIPAVNLIADGLTPAVSYDDLRYLNVLHYDFNGEVQTGEIICHKELAEDFMEIFYELYRSEYQIERIRLVDEYNGDDTASMADNNTSCFNYRVVDGTTSLSKHALGCAIDINPFYNPYVIYNRNNTGETYISPPGSEIYEDRTKNFPYKIDETDLCYRLFKEHGFTWGGDWNSSKDYQHFQKAIK